MPVLQAFRRFIGIAMLMSTNGCAAVTLSGGPMAGFSTADVTAVWLMGDGPGDAALEYWPRQQAAQRAASRPVKLSADNGFNARIDIEGLAPGTPYAYRILLDGKALPGDPEYTFRTQPRDTARPRDFTIAAGSCAHINAQSGGGAFSFSSGYGIFDEIAALKPDVMLWLGDHIYYRDEDFSGDRAARMNERWSISRRFPALQKLLRTGHHYAIWDDHEYGPNNANRTFEHKTEALALFKRYFANREYGTADAPGIFSRASFEDVDLFLLDDRYHRDDDDSADAPEKTMLGEHQLEWLKRELEKSRATFKLIANGSRMLSNRPSVNKRGGEGWHNFPHERDAFLQWLQAKRIDGVFLLSGDIHYTHMTQLARGGDYPLTELTCSPLTSRVHPRPQPVGEVPGTLVTERNFCTLEFSGPPQRRSMKVTSRSAEGMTLWEHEFPAADLRSAER